MDELIFRSLRQELSELEERQLLHWRALSPENEEHYQLLARLHAVPLERMGRPRGEAPARPSLAAIIDKAKARDTGVSGRARSRRRWVWLATAAAAAAVLLFVTREAVQRSKRSGTRTFAAAEFATAHQETVTATLTDGSVVRLGPDSRLRVHEVGPQREAYLEGRGFFAVAKDSTRPFIVHTVAGDVRVLGTRFELQARENKLRLAVVEGSVALRAGSVEVNVGAGEVGHVDRGAPPSVVKVADINAMLDWPSGLLVFQSTPLAQVVLELERYYRVRITISDSTLAHRPISAWFSDQTFAEALTTVCRVANAVCSIEDTVATMAQRP